MSFSLALYDASIANGSTLLQVGALADVVIAPANSGFLVNAALPKIMRIAAVGTNLTRVQLSSGSIRDYAPFDVGPVNVGTKIESPARFVDFSAAPIDLVVNEELDAFGVQSNAGAQRITVAVWFCDGPVRPVSGRFFTMHWTATTTLTANGWTSFLPVFDNGLPGGTFVIAGSRMISAGALFHRFITRGGPSIRPGTFSQQSQDDLPLDGARYGQMGEFIRFSNTTLPQIEVFSRSADNSEEGYLDLIQIA